MRECQAHISATEFMEWFAYDSIEPIGGRRLDVLFAALMQLIANINRGKDQPAFNLSDFLLDTGARREPQTPADVWKAIEKKFSLMESK